MASEMDQDVEIVVVDVGAVAGGYRVSELIRSAVGNDRGERVGTIDDFIIGGDDRVPFAVLPVGGFFCLGGRPVACPPVNPLLPPAARGPQDLLARGAR